MKGILKISLGLYALFIMQIAQAQLKKNTDPYFTDSEVRSRNFGVGLSIYPNYNNRRLLSNNINPGQTFNLVDNATNGSWTLGGGIDLYYNLGERFEIFSGLQYGEAEFEYPEVKLLNPVVGLPLDTGLSYQLTESFSFINIPLGLIFKTEMNDGWWLEFIPALEFSRLIKYDIEYKRNEVIRTEDALTIAENFFTWAGIHIGGTYIPYDTWGFSIRAHGKYMLNSLIQQENRPREVLYTIGASAGLQYRF